MVTGGEDQLKKFSSDSRIFLLMLKTSWEKLIIIKFYHKNYYYFYIIYHKFILK